MKKRIPTLLASFVVSLTFGTAHAAYTFRIGDFAVWKNFDPASMNSPANLLSTTPIFHDPFDDGSAPPAAPNFSGGGAASYAMHGNMGPESGGLLTLDSTGAVVSGAGTPLQQAILLTDTTPGDPSGLKQGNLSFAVGGIFNLINPGAGNGMYGVRFTDAGAGDGNDIVSLAVRGRADGKAVVDFSRYDLTTDAYTLIDRQVLDTTHSQIGLGLAYMDPDGTDPDPKAVYAAYFYLDGGTPGASFIDMQGHTQIFTGEVFTRAAFFAADASPAPVPEPSEYVLMLAGLGLVCLAARRRGA